MKLYSGLMMLVFISLWGCSGANDNAVILDSSGKHPVGWVVAANGGGHPAAHLSAPGKCTECHGNDLKGGISKVSCFSADRNGMTCHAQGPSGHPAGWGLGSAHGAHAKAAAVGSDGLAFCKNCHGADYRGGTAGVSCFSCHTASPHAPWLGATASIHSTTDVTNADACGGCHGGGAKLTAPIAPPANAGCFNNTLCHNVRHSTPTYSGSAHRPGGTGALLANSKAPYTNCSGCHETVTTGGPYPAAVPGDAPFCSGCHLNTTNFTGATPGCWDCHGNSATDGRPNGTTFPNRRGNIDDGHNRSDHMVACTICHPIATGSALHGWAAGRPKSVNAQVLPALNWIPGSRASGEGSCNPSAGGFTGCHNSKTGWY